MDNFLKSATGLCHSSGFGIFVLVIFSFVFRWFLNQENQDLSLLTIYIKLAVETKKGEENRKFHQGFEEI